jgi:uncharacterized protein (TIGR02118 family)
MITKLKLLSLCFAFIGLISCKTSQLKNSPAAEPGMFKVSILYPAGEGKTFDMGYYEKSHMPMMAGFLGKNLKFYEIDKGISGRTVQNPTPFVAMGYFYCYDIVEYNEAVEKNITAILADIKKYTNIQPVIQISVIRQLSLNNPK